MRDPYVYPGTTILINNKNIKDQSLLDKIEIALTYKALLTKIPAGNFDFQHLKTIHKHIFGELYPWAGEIRSVNIAKQSGTFCAAGFIEREIGNLFDQLAKDNHLKYIKNPKEFIQRFTHYFAEVNAIHPFREGNGRTTRQFFEQLAHHNGYKLDLTNISREEYIRACISSHNLDNNQLEGIFAKTLSPLIELNNVHKIYTELNKVLDKQFFKLSKEYIGVNWKIGTVTIFETKSLAEKAKSLDIDIIHANHAEILKYIKSKSAELNVEFERIKSKISTHDLTLSK